MRIVIYKTELNDDLHNVLIKEHGYNYLADKLDNPELIVKMLNDIFKLNKQTEEYMYMIALNIKCKVLGVFEISHGTVCNSFCEPREIFIKALLCGASSIILAHNHPSQNINPSKEDIAIYNRVKEAGKIIGVKLLDNIIVGEGYYSFEEKEI